MANARLMEDNESYQLLLQEKTLKGDFGQSDFSYMGASANQDALNALEGKTGGGGAGGAGGSGGGGAGGSSLADELSDAAAAEGDGDRRLEAELKNMKEQNKALTLYINRIIERLLQHQDFEHILDQSSDAKPSEPDTNKDLPPAPGDKALPNGPSLLQRAKTMAAAKPKQRPMSIMALASSTASGHTDPETAPSIPIGNLGRSASTRRSRPQSDQFTGGASLVSQMYKGPDGPTSPTIGNPRHSQTLFSGRTASASQAPCSGNFPGMRSETSSLSGESGDAISTPPSQSPPRSQSDKGTTFSGGKPRPLRLVQENQDAIKDNKRSSWYSGWSWGGKKEDAVHPPQTSSIPE